MAPQYRLSFRVGATVAALSLARGRDERTLLSVVA
jgi:hypothetical protein